MNRQEAQTKWRTWLFAFGYAHLVGISCGGRTDQLFGVFSLVLSGLVILYYFKYRDLPWQDFLAKIPVFFLIGAYLIVWFLAVVAKLYSFSYNLFDTGIFTNNIVNFVEKGTYYSSVLQMPALQDHFTPALLLFSPLMWFKPTILWLLFARLIGYGLTFYFLYRISRLLFQEKLYIMGLLLLWLLNSAPVKVLRFEFQPSTLAWPFIFGAFYLILTNRYVLAYIILLPTLGLKENMPLIYAVFGVYFLLVAKRTLLSIFWLGSAFLYAFVIYAAVVGITGFPLAHRDYLGPLAMPWKKLLFITELSLSFLLIPLFNFRLFAVFLASMATTLISGYESMATLTFHYHDIPSAFGMLVTVLVLKEFHDNPLKLLKLRKWLIVWQALLIIWVHSLTPVQTLWSSLPKEIHIILQKEIATFQRDLGAEARGMVFWLQENLGPPFIPFPELRSILPANEASLLAQDEAGDWVLVSEAIPPYNYNQEELKALVKKLEVKYQEESRGFRYLKVFRRKKDVANLHAK
ncbi:MAG: DUF2079 domain-containing protein [Leptospiraceae bacterium]|nr:DUF2079 domain-containing protein [Leptospiraceae bacterium]